MASVRTGGNAPDAQATVPPNTKWNGRRVRQQSTTIVRQCATSNGMAALRTVRETPAKTPAVSNKRCDHDIRPLHKAPIDNTEINAKSESLWASWAICTIPREV